LGDLSNALAGWAKAVADLFERLAGLAHQPKDLGVTDRVICDHRAHSKKSVFRSA
jgi:hypothetical protein